jgi:hypothetical protein
LCDLEREGRGIGRGVVGGGKKKIGMGDEGMDGRMESREWALEVAGARQVSKAEGVVVPKVSRHSPRSSVL